MKQIIGIASYYYLNSGAALLPVLPDVEIRAAERRMTSTKTLDGGVVITDSGFAHGDRPFNVSVESSQARWETLFALLQAAAQVVLSAPDGCYLAGLRAARDHGDKITLEILIREKISE